MKTIITAILLAFLSFDITDIAKINSLKEEAGEAYLKKDYQTAFDRYRMLVDSFQVTDDNLLLNYANCSYFLAGLKGRIDQGANNTGNSSSADIAVSSYQKLTSSKNKTIRSAAYNQLGVINYQMGNSLPQGEKYLNESLSYFKQSLKSHPQNDNARYNYEVVKKKLEEQQEQQQNQDQQNKDQEQQEKDDQEQEKQDREKQDQQQQKDQEQEQQEKDQQQDQEQQDQEQEQQNQQQQQEKEKEGEQQQQEEEQQQQQEQQQDQSTPEKLKEMKISEDMAKMILEALRNNEVQYLQQQKRRPTKKADGTKPDW